MLLTFENGGLEDLLATVLLLCCYCVANVLLTFENGGLEDLLHQVRDRVLEQRQRLLLRVVRCRLGVSSVV